MKLIALFVLGASLALAQPRPLDNIASRQYQHQVRPLRLALDRWLHELGLPEFGLSIRLVNASDLPPNASGMCNQTHNRGWRRQSRGFPGLRDIYQTRG